MSNIVLVILIVFLIANIMLGYFVWNKNKRSDTNILFFAFIIFITLWLTTNYLADNSNNPSSTYLWTKMTMASAAGIPFVILLLSYIFPKSRGLGYKRIIYFALPFIAISFVSLVGEGIIESAVVENGVTVVTFGDLAYLYGIYFILYIVIFIAYFISRFRKSTGLDRIRFEYLFFGLLMSIIAGTITNLIMPLVFDSFVLTPFGPLTTGFVVISTTYAILKHQLFDIRVLIRKIVFYSILLAVVFGVYTSIAIILTSYIPINETASSFLAAAIIAFGFEPLRQWLQNVTEKYLFVKEYDSEKEIGKLTQTLNNVVDLDEALRQMMQSVTQALKLDRAAILVLEKDEGDQNEYAVHLNGQNNNGDKNGLKVKRVQEINFPAPKRLMDSDSKIMINYLRHKSELILVEALEQEVEERRITNRQLSKMVDQDRHHQLTSHHESAERLGKLVDYLKSIKVSVVIPIMIKQKLIGTLYLGEKLSNDSFYEDDLNYLSIVGAQTASAIEKARFYEEDQLKSEFVSIASHELLTPTAAIEGYLSMILEEKMAKVDPKAEEYLWKVYSSAQRLSKLVKDLLSVSRIEAGRIKIEPKVFDLAEVVQQQIDQLVVRAKEAGLKLEYKKPAKEIKVFADPERVAQAVVNLVGNSIKYTKKGSVTISIVDSAKFSEVQVTDTGIGIKEEDREHLFEKFHRVDSKETAGIIGTGLGLYITKSIIELMGGKIWVKSTVGKGSTFAFSIPKHKSA